VLCASDAAAAVARKLLTFEGKPLVVAGGARLAHSINLTARPADQTDQGPAVGGRVNSRGRTGRTTCHSGYGEKESTIDN